ncbi:Protein of unknown function [Gryllus bimaculatus]|nr:Protein of unknown function [Gryllus bimaculatus]
MSILRSRENYQFASCLPLPKILPRSVWKMEPQAANVDCSESTHLEENSVPHRVVLSRGNKGVFGDISERSRKRKKKYYET